jgi:hypothetical protein
MERLSCLLNAPAIGIASAKKSKSLQALSQLDTMGEIYWERWNGKRSQRKSELKDAKASSPLRLEKLESYDKDAD